MLLLLLCYAACRLCSIGSFISAALLVVVVAHWGVCSIERLNSRQQQLLLHNEENINVLSFTVRLGSVRVWSPASALLVVFGCSAPIFLRQRPRLERACCTRTPTLCAPISLSRFLSHSLSLCVVLFCPFSLKLHWFFAHSGHTISVIVLPGAALPRHALLFVREEKRGELRQCES